MSGIARSRYARGEQRRNELIAATIELISERGVEGVSHRLVAARAGVPLSSTSYFFGSIDDMIAAAVTEVCDGLLRRLESVSAQFVAGDVTVDEFVDRIVDVAMTVNRTEEIAQFEAYLAADRRHDLRVAAERVLSGFEAAALEALRAIGVANPEMLSRQIVAMIDGFALHRIVREGYDTAPHLAAAVKVLVEADSAPM
ncbi:TetR/AcrR family transcriptional regulator [Gordonia shandongensis]|uniref:TetR/AcrR family transcriptional regulator n=1 Tax=Gordonia shandongensis TaxID=376351 RepID=UPI000424E99D|nr:TetR/AcrR family transcriptional regulator [Gordonia shandongensis]